jgi:hypothetical protein
MRRLRSICALALIVPALASGCAGGKGSSDDRSSSPAPQPASGAPPWPAPSDPIARTVAAGLKPERKEFFAVHSHAHLDVFVNGEPVEVPAGIGIDITDPGVQRFEDAGGIGYGGIELCDNPCISPLHTHDTTGVLHTEAPENETNTLGEFFVEWGVRLDERCVGGFCEPEAPIAVYVDGEPYDGGPSRDRARGREGDRDRDRLVPERGAFDLRFLERIAPITFALTTAMAKPRTTAKQAYPA